MNPDLWPILSFAANIVMALALYSLRTTIKLAVSELKIEFAKEYATQKDVESAEARLDDKIALKKTIENGFTDIRSHIRGEGSMAQ